MKQRLYGLTPKMALIQEALRFNNRTDLAKKNTTLYREIQLRGLLSTVFPLLSDMADEDLLNEAQTLIEKNGIPNRSEFSVHHPGLYRQLKKRQLMDQLMPKHQHTPKEYERPHHKVRKRKHGQGVTDEEIMAAGAKYDSRRAFKMSEDSVLYALAVRRRLLKQLFNHPVDFKSTDEEIITHCSGFNSRKDLMLMDQRAYTLASKRGLLDQIKHAKQKPKRADVWAIPASGIEQTALF